MMDRYFRKREKYTAVTRAFATQFSFTFVGKYTEKVDIRKVYYVGSIFST